jgi:hypothetical protein
MDMFKFLISGFGRSFSESVILAFGLGCGMQNNCVKTTQNKTIQN